MSNRPSLISENDGIKSSIEVKRSLTFSILSAIIDLSEKLSSGVSKPNIPITQFIAASIGAKIMSVIKPDAKPSPSSIDVSIPPMSTLNILPIQSIADDTVENSFSIIDVKRSENENDSSASAAFSNPILPNTHATPSFKRSSGAATNISNRLITPCFKPSSMPPSLNPSIKPVIAANAPIAIVKGKKILPKTLPSLPTVCPKVRAILRTDPIPLIIVPPKIAKKPATAIPIPLRLSITRSFAVPQSPPTIAWIVLYISSKKLITESTILYSVSGEKRSMPIAPRAPIKPAPFLKLSENLSNLFPIPSMPSAIWNRRELFSAASLAASRRFSSLCAPSLIASICS